MGRTRYLDPNLQPSLRDPDFNPGPAMSHAEALRRAEQAALEKRAAREREKAAKREAREANQKRTKRESYIKSKYGVDRAVYRELGERQEHRCIACRRHESEFTRGLSVDRTSAGTVRALLCPYCVLTLRHTGESSDLLRRLATYLDYFSKNT